MNHQQTETIFNSLIKMLFSLENEDISAYEEEKKNYDKIKERFKENNRET